MNGLAVENLSKSFSGLQALSDITFTVEPGERRAIIGPNGAGKSTLFNVIAGQLSPSGGKVWLGGKNVTGLPAYAMWKRGMTRTFQRNSVFQERSALANVRLAVIARRRSGFRIAPGSRLHEEIDAEALRALHRVNLANRKAVPAHELAYGEQRQLEVAIALAGDPKFLLLDEPTAGMSPAETTTMIGMLSELSRDITVLIVEHDMDVVFAIADIVTVLHQGRILAEGTPQEIQVDPRVIEVYLGRQGEAA